MSGHCPGCGEYCEEDDSRLCATCKHGDTMTTPPTTPATSEGPYSVSGVSVWCKGNCVATCINVSHAESYARTLNTAHSRAIAEATAKVEELVRAAKLVDDIPTTAALSYLRSALKALDPASNHSK